MNIEQLLQRIVDLENQVSDMKNQKDSATVQDRLNTLQYNQDKMSVDINNIQNILDKFDSEDIYIETFSKDEINQLYNRSGLSMPDVATFISKLYRGKDVSLEEAWGWISGAKNDIRTVSRLGKYLRKKALLNAD